MASSYSKTVITSTGVEIGNPDIEKVPSGSVGYIIHEGSSIGTPFAFHVGLMNSVPAPSTVYVIKDGVSPIHRT